MATETGSLSNSTDIKEINNILTSNQTDRKSENIETSQNTSDIIDNDPNLVSTFYYAAGSIINYMFNTLISPFYTKKKEEVESVNEKMPESLPVSRFKFDANHHTYNQPPAEHTFYNDNPFRNDLIDENSSFDPIEEAIEVEPCDSHAPSHQPPNHDHNMKYNDNLYSSNGMNMSQPPTQPYVFPILHSQTITDEDVLTNITNTQEVLDIELVPTPSSLESLYDSTHESKPNMTCAWPKKVTPAENNLDETDLPKILPSQPQSREQQELLSHWIDIPPEELLSYWIDIPPEPPPNELNNFIAMRVFKMSSSETGSHDFLLIVDCFSNFGHKQPLLKSAEAFNHHGIMTRSPTPKSSTNQYQQDLSPLLAVVAHNSLESNHLQVLHYEALLARVPNDLLPKEVIGWTEFIMKINTISTNLINKLLKDKRKKRNNHLRRMKRIKKCKVDDMVLVRKYNLNYHPITTFTTQIRRLSCLLQYNIIS
jgi:hypothetical protein